MYRMAAEIKIIDNGGGYISEIDDSQIKQYYTNVSGTFYDVVNTNKTAKNIFLLSEKDNPISLLDGSKMFADKQDYVILYDSDQDRTLYFYGDNITSFTIAFDEKHNCYPLSFTVSELTLKSGSAQHSVNSSDYDIKTSFVFEPSSSRVVVPLENPCDGVAINFNSNEYSNYPNTLIVTGLNSDSYVYVNTRNIDASTITFGSLSGNGEAEFSVKTYTDTLSVYDFDGEILDYIKRGFIKKGSIVKIYLENSLTKRRQYFGQRVISSISRSQDTRVVTFNITTNAQSLQNIDFSNDIMTRSVEEIFDKCCDLSDNVIVIDNMYSSEDEEVMSAQIYHYDSDSSVYSDLTDVCIATGRNLAVNIDGIMELK